MPHNTLKKVIYIPKESNIYLLQKQWKNKVSSKRDREDTLEASVKFVQELEPWAVLKPHMPVYLNIIQQISSYLEKKNEKSESAKCEDNSLEESHYFF